MPATVGNVSVGTAATLIIGANAARQELSLANYSASPDVFIGPDDTVTTSNGLPLLSSTELHRDRGHGTWLGDVWGIVATGTADVRFWQTTK